MDATTINQLVRSLGQTYNELLKDGLLHEGALEPLFKEGKNEELIQKPAPGIELWFWAETKRLERIVITLSAMIESDPIYTGELPPPFAHQMNQTGIRAALGEPYLSKGPAKLPPPIGMTGGWDVYRLDKNIHPNAEVAIQFLGNKSASGLAFRLIDKGHD